MSEKRSPDKAIDQIQQHLVDYACALEYENLTSEAINAAKAFIIDTLGVLVSGFCYEPCRIARDMSEALACNDGATITNLLSDPFSLNLALGVSQTFNLAQVMEINGGTSTITVTPQNGFSSSVSLSASGLPSGVTASFSPNPANTSSTLTLTAASSATIGLCEFPTT